jgi:hypothetical protein
VSLRGRDPQHYFTVEAALPPKARRGHFFVWIFGNAGGISRSEAENAPLVVAVRAGLSTPDA